MSSPTSDRGPHTSAKQSRGVKKISRRLLAGGGKISLTLFLRRSDLTRPSDGNIYQRTAKGQHKPIARRHIVPDQVNASHTADYTEWPPVVKLSVCWRTFGQLFITHPLKGEGSVDKQLQLNTLMSGGILTKGSCSCRARHELRRGDAVRVSQSGLRSQGGDPAYAVATS